MTASLRTDPSPPRLAWKQIDGGRGPYLFMVHGMLSSHRQWRPNLDALCRFARPVLFDLWGHGDAPCPLDDDPYRVTALLEQFDRVREELGVDRVLLCGQSLGASLTLRYSIERPRAVIAQVFTNSVSALTSPEMFGSTHERHARAALIETGGRAALEKMPFHPRNGRRIQPPLRDELIAMADAVDPRAVARLSRITGPQLSVLDDLGRIGCPTLLVNGAWEKAFQPLRAVAANRISGCRIADVAAGHAVNCEEPAAFDAAVGEFLGSLVD